MVCGDASTVYNCDLDVNPDSNLIQNGSPDGVALYAGTTLLDTVSYEGDLDAPLYRNQTAPDWKIRHLHCSSESAGHRMAPTAMSITSISANAVLHRDLPIRLENTNCVDPTPPPLRINEIDYDQPGIDTAEFVEIINAGNSPADLDGVSLVLVNGNGDAPYQTIALPAVALGAGDYFVVCGNAATVANCDLEAISLHSKRCARCGGTDTRRSGSRHRQL